MTWDIYELEIFPPTAHVIPRDDLIEHEFDDECPCGPEQFPVTREVDGAVSWIVGHSSLDGREADERARRLH